MTSIISATAYARRRELIELLDKAITLGEQLNQELDAIGNILADSSVKIKEAA